MRSMPRRHDLRRVAVITGAAVLLALTGPVSIASASPTPPKPAQQTQTSTVLTADDALRQAKTSGIAVAVPGATNPTDTLTANPDGSLTLTRTVLPVRKRVAGTWKDLDATLARNSNGNISPAITTTDLTLSGGGTGPLVTLNGNGGATLALTLPMTLPTPTLDGDTAIYHDVLSGVDLQVTADTQGGVSEVLVVNDASAATNPALRSLIFTADTTGVTLNADAAGNIAATNPGGQVMFSAPAPLMWDSAAASPPAGQTKTDSVSGATLDASTGEPVTSSADGPGEAAHTAPVAVATTDDGIDLTPNQALLTAATTTYPVYIDPSWSTTELKNSGWATVAKQYGDTNYWKNTTDPYGYMQVGQGAGILSRTFVNFALPLSTLSGAVINSATMTITENYSWSCDARQVDLYAPSTTLTQSNATWNYWATQSLGGIVDHQSVAHGYNSSCPAAGVGFTVTGAVRTAVTNHKGTQTFALLADNESDQYSWKKFISSTAALTITYDHKPAKPSALRTSPATSCTANTPVGDGPVSLYATVSDLDGGSLGVTFDLWRHSDGKQIASSNPALLTYGSGTTAVLVVPEATLKAAAGADLTEFSWNVQVTDTNLTSDPSTTCNFSFDPTRTGPPHINPPAGDTTIGTSANFDITKPDTGDTPTGYEYQLNGDAPIERDATDGHLTISITPTRYTNVLTVSGLSAGGNIGETAIEIFNSTAPALASPGDLTGDGNADLLAVGETANLPNLPAGLWLAAGLGNGNISTAATDIGANGNGNIDNAPTDFTGARVITGNFTGGNLQDILAYYPPTDTNPGHGVVLAGNGDGSTIQAQYSENVFPVISDELADFNTDYPQQVVNAGVSNGFSDLIAVSGDPTIGYYLDYYPNNATSGGYQIPDELDGVTTPDGTMDWNNWTIATTQLPDSTTAMYLWNHTTGALYLWQNLTHTIGKTDLGHTQYTLADGTTKTWNKNQNLALQAADINGDATPDLWTVTASTSGTVAAAYLATNLTTNPTLTPQTNQTLLAATHTWALNEGTADHRVDTAADTTGNANLTSTSTGTVEWHGGDLYDPDLQLNTDSTGTIPDTNPTGVLTNNTPLIDTNKSFSIGAWVKPTVAGGVIVSEDGAHSSRFILWDNEADNTWRFGMATGDTTAWSYDQAIAYAPQDQIHLGVWTHLVATYDATTHFMALYVNDTIAATGTHTATISWPSTGKFTVGDYLYNTTHSSYYAGQISNLQTWNTAITASQIHPNTKQPTPPAALKDFDGDGKADIVASDSSGALWLYPGTNTPGLATRKQIGTSGWNSMTSINLADINHDGKPDIVAIDTAGNLWLYPNTTSSTDTPSLGGRSQIGIGWGGLNAINTADINGDSLIDIVARDSAGNLQLYPNTGNIGARTFIGPFQVGYGWNNLTFINTPDLTGDSLADLIARNTAGNLQLYPNTGANSFTGPIQIPNWNSTTDTLITFEDLNGDGRPDLLARDTAGNLQLYPNTTNNGATTFGSPTQIGNGWATFTIAL